MTPAELKAHVNTIVIVFMENRSFDHVFGSLSLPKYGGRQDIDGIKDLGSLDYANNSPTDEAIPPFVTDDKPFEKDIPHDRRSVATQIDLDADNNGSMTGFVNAFYQTYGVANLAQPPPMGILSPTAAPMSQYLAQHYTLCQRWFAPIPTSTFPNRLMAMCGDTLSDQTAPAIVPDQDTVYHYLESLGVRWRVYHQGLPFLLLMKKVWPFLPTERFRRYEQLAQDIAKEPDGSWPEVIFVEPDYFDSPIRLSGQPCDDHAPLPIVYGERFLQGLYTTLSQSRRWKSTVLIYTFDEHGGFYDHVPPLNVPQAAPAGQYPPFQTTGPRVPAIVASPMTKATVSSEPLDHTSILQLLAERFGDPAHPITASVAKRRQAGISSVSALLDPTISRMNIPPPAPIPGPGRQMEPAYQPVPSDWGKAIGLAVSGLVETVGWVENVYSEALAWLKAEAKKV